MNRAFLAALLFAGIVVGGVGAEKTTILFLGDSLTAGYGLSKQEAYPALVGKQLEAAGIPVKIVNAGVSGDTTAGGLRRLAWALRSKPDVLVLALGANDGLRGIDLDSTRKNLQAIIDRAHKQFPDLKIVVAGMQVPPNLGDDYTKEFRNIFPALAKKNDAALIPFLLEGVGGEPDLNQNDGIHPNAEGHKIIAGAVSGVLIKLLKPEP